MAIILLKSKVCAASGLTGILANKVDPMNEKARGRSALHFSSIFYVIGLILAFTSLSLTLPLITAIFYGENKAMWSFILTMIIGLVLGASLYFPLKPQFNARALRQREACFIVTFSWLVLAMLSALPYLLSGSFNVEGPFGPLQAFTNAYFESMSGLTTTGASVVNDIQGLPKSILLWRSETQWLGGMGIILLSVAILPLLGVGGMQLFKAEVPGISVDKLTPRISETAKSLWMLYVILTGFEFILLVMGKMPVFDAACHAFSTLSTGGFSPKNISVEHYDSLYFEIVMTVFMFCGGLNFVLIYKAFQGKLLSVISDMEFRVYAFLIFLSLALISTNLWFSGTYGSILQAARYAIFQIVSIMTTTGFSSQNWESWPAFSQSLLLALMLLGGMAGSTAGGAKIIRLVILLKYAVRELQMIVHPRAVISIKLGEHPVSREIIRSVLAFFAIFSLLLIFGTLALTGLGVDMLTAFSAVLTSVGNVGPGVNLVGAGHNFHDIPILGKWILIICMLLGRLEIYTAFVLLLPAFWKK